VPDHDVQGNLKAPEKLKLVEFAIEHLRKFNPKSYLIIAGHGHRPSNLSTFDHHHWEDRCLPLDQHGYVVGMPAQYRFVSLGIEHAKEKGFKRILKTRGDCVIGIKNVTAHCNGILETERKPLLVTQQTGPDERMGDCFMYGDVDLLLKTWHRSNEVLHADGLQNTALHFREAVGDKDSPWLSLVKRTCALRDIHNLKFTCLRWNFHRLGGLSDEVRRQMLDDEFDFAAYHWGKTNGAHVFDADGTMHGSGSWMWSEKSFYGG
jgi:hypothetical protein